jgi:hypothetical protein
MIHGTAVRHPALRRIRDCAVILFFTSALGGACVSSAAASTPPSLRVRSTDATVLRLIQEGMERSATFRAIVETIDRMDGVVYVEFGYCAFGRINGCLLPFVGSANGDRYLRVVIIKDKNRQTQDHLLGIIAHELTHVIEVLAHPEVVDVKTLEAMYRRIGTPEVTGHSGYETSAARSAGDAVLSELSEKHVEGKRADAPTIRPQ